jgi:hypothetical protein
MNDEQSNQGPMTAERLRKIVAEDVESAEEATALLATVQRLSRWSVPQPAEHETAHLVDVLIGQMPRQSSLRRASQRLMEWWPLLLLHAQMRIVRRSIWAASALVIALGTFVTVASYDTLRSGDALPLVWVAPLVAALGVAYLYGPDAELPLEVELATPVSRRLVLLARLALLFGFDLGLGLIGSGVLVVLHSGLSLWPLVLAWLAPMAFLSALAFLVSVLCLDPMAGILIGLALWITQSLARFWTLPWILPDLLTTEARPWLILLALLMGGAALWFAGRDERLLRNLA